MASSTEFFVWQKVKSFAMQYKRAELLYAFEILYSTFSLLNALLKKTLKLSTGGTECVQSYRYQVFTNKTLRQKCPADAVVKRTAQFVDFDGFAAVRVHGVGQQNGEPVVLGIKPEAGACKPLEAIGFGTQ